MRLAPMSIVSAVLVAFMVSPRPAAAHFQTFDGLYHHSQGSADFVYDPVARRLTVQNIGSTGQDGVAIDLPNEQASPVGPGVTFADGVVIRGSALGSTLERVLTMYSGPTVAGTLTMHRNSDGTETVTSDYTASGATRVTVFVFDAKGNRVAGQTVTGGSMALTISGAGFVAEDGYTAHRFDATHRKMQVHYPTPITISGSNFVQVTGTSCQFHCADGYTLDALTSVQLTGTTAAGAPAGEWTFDQVGIVPPCAGCPNGPDDLGMCVALGDATYALGTSSTGERRREMHNLGSSGQDGVRMSLRGGRTDCCSAGAGYTNLFVYNRPTPRTLDTDVSGDVGGIEQSLGTMHVDVPVDHADFHPDFSAAGAGGYRVRLYHDGAVIADVTDPVSVTHLDAGAEWRLQTDVQTSTGAAGFRIICITSPCPGWPVAVNGALYFADEIAFEPSGTALAATAVPTNLTSFSLRATGDELPIGSVTVNSSAPNVGVAPRTAPDGRGARLFPNPAAGPVSVVFALPQRSAAEVAVIDVSGRRVRELARRTFAPGAHELRWDGLDESGRPAAVGTYFVRVRSTAGEQVARLTMLR